MTAEELIYFKNRGDVMPESILVETNVFNAPERIREIDPDYFVVFDPRNQKFELHHKEQEFTPCFVFPFDELDGRAVDYVQDSRIERFRDKIQKMEENNRKIEEAQHKEFMDKIEVTAKDIHTYALRHDDDQQKKAFKNAYKTREV
jgi:hypothetical protein